MTYFLRNGSHYSVTDESNLDITTTLPPGNYIVNYDPQKDLYSLERTENFKPIKKHYGDATKRVDRILRTFQDRPSSLGVMLAGEKGSGKSLLSKEISIRAATQGIPTILVNKDYHGDTFNKFISSIEQEVIVLFDEFEKIYEDKKQEAILTLFDGVFPSRKLFIVSINDIFRINSHMRNRPGRFYYFYEFFGIEEDFIREYCHDQGFRTDWTNELVTFAKLFANFNFDMMKAIVEESVRYDEPPSETTKIINARPEGDKGSSYKTELFDITTGKPLKISHPHTISDPLTKKEIGVSFYIAKADTTDFDPEDEDGEETVYRSATFKPTNLLSFDANAGAFEFQSDNYKLRLTRELPGFFNWSKAF